MELEEPRKNQIPKPQPGGRWREATSPPPRHHRSPLLPWPPPINIPPPTNSLLQFPNHSSSRHFQRLVEASRGPQMVVAVAPPGDERCAVCRDDFSIPHQANCSHWFCGHCIVGVWFHGSVLQPCKCPLCRRPITLLIPSEAACLLRNEPEVAPVFKHIEQYNRRFGGTSCNLIQRLEDQPFYIRRMLTELRDPRRAFPLFFKVRITLAVIISVLYLLSPVDFVPEGVLGFVGFLDDMLILVVACFYISAAYRGILLRRHGG